MGILYIIATPIGNLRDITLRALEILKGVDLILCEDTRVTSKLLAHYNISKPLVSYFQHSKLSKIEYIAEELACGKNIALVTDAGTPGIADPGGMLINQLVSSSVGRFKNIRLKDRGSAETEELKNWQTDKPIRSIATENDKLANRRTDKLIIVPMPGSNAAIAALSVSGFPTDKFVFMGFPPHKKGRQKFFDEVANAKYTVVFYESTHRILKALKELVNKFQVSSFKRREIVVCRELTKTFESIYRGTAKEILEILESDKNNQKGEFVIVVNHA